MAPAAGKDSVRAADRRPGAYSAGLAFERQRSFVLANLLPLAGVLSSAAVVSAAIWFAAPGGAGARGFAAGLFLAGILGAVAHWVSIASGSAQASMGQAAEEWTATELRRLHRRGWRTVNHVMFRTWDVDHIAVGSDGVIVLETKWRSGRIDLDDPDGWLEAAAERLRRNERDVAGFLGWGARPDARVTSLLVVWGPEVGQDGDEPIRAPQGVNVLAGQHLRRNLEDLHEVHLEPAEVAAIHAKLLRQARSRDAHGGPPRPTLRDAANRWLLTFGAGLAGALLAVLALHLGWWYFAAAAVLAAAGLLVARTPGRRAPGLAWLIGSQAVTLALLVALAFAAVGS